MNTADTNTPVTPDESPADAPAWFTHAISRPRQSHHADSLGNRLHYLSWNEQDMAKPAMLFVHGMLGHAHWWDFIAPFFTDRFRVFALDLSGMGDSGHRAQYDQSTFSNDIAEALRAIGSSPATVVAHSFGGARLLDACQAYPELISHAVVIDSIYGSDAAEVVARNNRTPANAGTPRFYTDEATALSRFKLLPEQDTLPYLRDYVARYSVKQVSDGWTWRFDPQVRLLKRESTGMDTLALLRMPVDYVYGATSSVVGDAFAHRLVNALAHGRGPVKVPAAGHHIMLDQPLALVSALNALLAPVRG